MNKINKFRVLLIGVFFAGYINAAEVTSGIKIFSGCFDNVHCNLEGDEMGEIVLRGARNQHQAKLVTILSKENIDNIGIHISTFRNKDSGEELPAINTNMRYVIGWYREKNAYKTIHHGIGKKYYYDILAYDNKLLMSDHKNNTTKIKIGGAGQESYTSINKLTSFSCKDIGKDGRIKYKKEEIEIHDADTLAKVSMAKDETLTVLLETRLTGSIPAGEYVGTLSIRSGDKIIREIGITYKVEDIVLDDSGIDYCIYYRGRYLDGKETFSSEYKTVEQLTRELSNIKSAGFNCITIYQELNNMSRWNTYMSVAESLNFEKYIIADSTLISYANNSERRSFEELLKQYENVLGHGKWVGFYMVDEPSKTKNKEIKSYKKLISEMGYYPVTGGRFDRIKEGAEKGEVYVVAYELSVDKSEYFRSRGAAVYSYANPQVGVISPLQFRKNYGFKLHINNYNGAMPYAYQDSRGIMWDDTDGRYRDHMFTYPIQNGLLETVSWMGMKEAIVDSRIITTRDNLVKKLKSDKCNFSMVLNDISVAPSDRWTDIELIRERLINELVALKNKHEECISNE